MPMFRPAGLMAPQQPSAGGLMGGDWLSGAKDWVANNPGVLSQLGAGLMGGDLAGGFANASRMQQIAQERQRKEATKGKIAQLFLQKGIASTPEEASLYAESPEIIQFFQKSKGKLINAGDGRLYNEDTGEWIVAPGSNTKAPQVSEMYDADGNSYKAQWNVETGQWDKLGGVKKTRDKVDEYTRKNRSLYRVVAPEVANLLGDGSAPGKFDALASTANQAGDFVGGLGKTIGGPDLSGYTTGADYQSAKNSLKTIVASYLYSVSGATANPGEVETQTNILMPRAGEASESVKQKKARIKTMVDAIQQASQQGAVDGVAPPDDGVVDAADYFGGTN